MSSLHRASHSLTRLLAQKALETEHVRSACFLWASHQLGLLPSSLGLPLPDKIAQTAVSDRYCQLDAEEATLPRGLSRLAYGRGTGSITPSGICAIARSAVLTGAEGMAGELEVIVNPNVSGK